MFDLKQIIDNKIIDPFLYLKYFKSAV